MVIVPVATEHVGCVMVAAGAVGIVGCALTTWLDDAGEVHPAALSTVNVQLFARAVTNPVPDMIQPDDGVKLQVLAGSYELIWNVPVVTEQVGCVTGPAVGAEGVAGCALTTWLPVDATQLPVVVLFT